MWSSALMRIERNLGRDKTMTLSLEAAYSFTKNMTMAQAAQLYIKTDDLINEGQNYTELCWIFKDKGFVQSCTTPRPNNLLGIKTPKTNSSIILLNTLSFAQGIEPLTIRSKSEFNINIYDIGGNLIYHKERNQFDTNISPDLFKIGIYVIRIKNKEEEFSTRIIRF